MANYFSIEPQFDFICSTKCQARGFLFAHATRKIYFVAQTFCSVCCIDKTAIKHVNVNGNIKERAEKISKIYRSVSYLLCKIQLKNCYFIRCISLYNYLSIATLL